MLSSIEISTCFEPVICQLPGWKTIDGNNLSEVKAFISQSSCHDGDGINNVERDAEIKFISIFLSNVTFNYFEFSDNYSVKIDNLKAHYLVVVPIKGYLKAAIDDIEIEVNSEQALVISPAACVDLYVPSGTLVRFVEISRVMVDKVSESCSDYFVPRLSGLDTVVDLNEGMAASWIRMVDFLEAEFLYQTPAFWDGTIENQFSKIVGAGLLFSKVHDSSNGLARPISTLVPSYVRTAEWYIQVNARNFLDVDEVVKKSGVAKRTLYEGFRRFLNTTPKNYLKMIRMEGARRDILAMESKTTISDVARSWGITHMGRFAMDYKALYDESPVNTQQRVLSALH